MKGEVQTGGISMLQAVISGKGSVRAAHTGESLPLRQVLSGSEDVLTAAVFERLCYLEAPLAWEILRLATGSSLFPPRRLVTLKSAEFWPRWSNDESDKSFIEPDVVLEFDVGEPAELVRIVVESKHQMAQSASQLVGELRMADALNNEDKKSIILAIGGLPSNRATSVSLFESAEPGLEGRCAAAGWNDLAEAVRVVGRTGGDRFIMSDLIAALAVSGYRAITALDSLRSYAPTKSTFAASLNTLADQKIQ